MKKIIYIIVVIYLMKSLFSDQRYTGNVHEYLMEESYELLKIDMEHEFPEMNDYLDKLIKGAKNEDKQDWIYGYKELNPPNFNQYFAPEIVIQIGMLLFNDGGDPFVTITHFWGADEGSSNNTFLSGTIPILAIPTYWSFYCENAMQKASEFFEGGEITPHYEFADIHFVEANQLAFASHWIKIENLQSFYQTGICRVYNSYGYIGNFHLIESEKLALFYEIIGRICHLIMDMSVPAHAHQDQHAPEPEHSDGDQYEGDVEEDFGFMIYPENWYWNGINTYVDKGGLLDISIEADPLLYLMYMTNQVADFFASDDVDGNSDLWNDISVQNANAHLQSKFNELESQGYTSNHSTRTHHEMTVDDCTQIRDEVFPFAMRSVATFLEYIAQEYNIPANYIPKPFCDLQGCVSLIGNYGIIENTSIHFQSSSNSFTINPDIYGFYNYFFYSDDFGYYTITYDLENYQIETETVMISGNTQSLPNVVLIPKMNGPIFVKQDGTGDFENIAYAVQSVEQNGLIYVSGPETYMGENNRNISWNGNNKDIHIFGINNPIIDCENEGMLFNITNGNENDIIQGLTIQNASTSPAEGGAIRVNDGFITIINNTFINCHSGNYQANYEMSCVNWQYSKGGAIYIKHLNDTQSSEITGNNFENCVAFEGGAICIEEGYCLVEDNIFDNNHACYNDLGTGNNGRGGAIHLISAAADIIDNNFISNSAAHEGLVISAYMACYPVIVSNNRFDSNYRGYNGTLCEVPVLALCSTFNNNIVINHTFINEMLNFSLVAINNNLNNTFINNSVHLTDIGIEELEFSNCIFMNNSAPLNGNYFINDEVLTYCLIENSGNTTNATITNCIENTDPQLDPETYQPIWNSTTKSPCIDAGDPNSDLDSDGTPADIGAVCATPHKYDIIELPSPEIDSGWKWLSFPALDDVYSIGGDDPNDPDVAEYLLESITGLPYPAVLDKVELPGGDDEIVLFQNQWQNFTHQFESVNGYKFHMNETATLDVPGFVENPNTQIDLTGGIDNWIGYFLEDSQLVTEAFSQIWDDLYVIQHQHWCMTKIGPQWYYWQTKREPVLEYGDMINVKCYNSHSDFQWCNDTPGDDEDTIPEPEYFFFTEKADYIPIYVEFDPEDIPAEVGVFVDGVCKGATVVEGENAQILAYIVDGEQGNVEFEFYYNSRSQNKRLTSYNCVSSQNSSQVQQQINVKEKPDAWLVTFREGSNIISAPENVTLNNYPNPFNPTTTIAYGLPYEDRISLSIYNIKGQLVRQLVSGSQPEGYYDVVWNGKDDTGKQVSSGIYYYRITACGKTLNKKMLMLK